MKSDELNPDLCNDLCRDLIETCKKHTSDHRVCIVALANVSGNLVSSIGNAEGIVNGLKNFIHHLSLALEEYGPPGVGVEVMSAAVQDVGPCPVHGDKCPDSTVH